MEGEGRDNALFEISLSLTEKGMEMRNQVIGMVFKAIAKVTKNGIKKYTWKEARRQALNSWKFQGRTSDTFDQAMGVVGAMMKEPLETYPRTLSIIQRYNPKGAMAILKLLKPSTVYLSQMGGQFPPADIEGAVQIEKFYKAEFAIAKIPADVLKLWNQCAGADGDADTSAVDTLWGDAEFKYPPKNKYIPRKLRVSKVDPAAPQFPSLPHPVLAEEDAFGKLYVGKDKIFGDPYITASIQVKTAGALTEKYGPKARIMTQLWLECISESLKDQKYPFSVAGLSGSLSMGKGTNLYVSFGGKVPKRKSYMELLRMLLAPMKKPLSSFCSKDTFEMIRKANVRSYANQLKSGPSSTASRTLWTAFSNTRTPVDELLAAAQKITEAEVGKFVPELLAKVSLEAFIYGQLGMKKAKEIYTLVKESLKAKPGGEEHAPTMEEVMLAAQKNAPVAQNTTALSQADAFVSKLRVLPDEKGPWFSTVSGIARGNATLLMIDGGHLPCSEGLALKILYKEVGQMFFNELRTKQQTGYVASSYATYVARHTVALFMVESSWAGPGDLVNRYEGFIKLVLDGLHNGTVMTDKKLNMIRKSMLSKFLKPIQNIQAMGSTLESIIKDEDCDWDSMKKMKALLTQVTREKIVEVAKKVLGPQNKRRFAVMYTPNGVRPDATPPQYTPFNPAIGQFVAKPKYKCDVCLDCKAPPPKPANATMPNATNATRSLIEVSDVLDAMTLVDLDATEVVPLN
jgi:secreted Zn-dependent insulinase-like peptidase